jgi:addiction module RelE/StbE family toxin
MFEIKSIKAVKRDLKKLPRDLLNDLKTVHFTNIRENPFQGYELGYVFKGLRSYHLNHKGKSYRIVYEVFKEDELVVINMIGSRESFYEKLRRRVL